VNRGGKANEIRRLRERSRKDRSTEVAFQSLGSWVGQGELVPAAAALSFMASERLRKIRGEQSAAASAMENMTTALLSAWVHKRAYDKGKGDE
jgi:hypothetical protein